MPALRVKQPDAMPTITLSGCAPVPLAHYLKALGILRLVAEQTDSRTTAHWIGNQFVLKSRFDQKHELSLAEFFLRDYRPTPIAVPWSGGDFFAVNREKPAKSFDKTPTSARVIEAIMSTDAARLDDYRNVLRATFSAMDKAGVAKKKDIEGSGGPQRRLKAEMLKSLRSSLPDEALAWMDAAAVIEPDAVAFNALLGGGGGSDGNSHFSDNFMQCLWMALPEFDLQREKPVKAVGKDGVFNSRAALNESLYGTEGTGTKIPDLSPVLFDSTRVGGPNQTNGFEAKAGSNPWDFILMLEGSVLFAGAIGRKLDDQREPSARFPFLFQASPVGLGSSYLGESAGRELWLPLWSNPTTLAEIRALLAEGRVEKHGRMAKRGTDAFVAAAQLGFDRGITSFQRTGFFKGRIGGDNYFTAIDQGRITPHRNQKVDLLRDTDDWLAKLASASTSDKCPAAVSSAAVALERRIADLAVAAQNTSSSQLLAVLAAFGTTERALVQSFKWTTKTAHLRPLHGLREQWLYDADDGSAEFRLAQSVAGMSAWLGKETLWFRQHLEPLGITANKERSWVSWDDTAGNDVAWHDGDLTDALNAILSRRVMRVGQSGAKGWPDESKRFARLDDITDFIEGRTNDDLLADLIWGLSLLDWQKVERSSSKSPEVIPSSFYAMLRLCFRPATGNEDAIPIVPAILHRAMSGDGQSASELAARRLRGSGKAPLVKDLPVSGDIARRTAAAILFPISHDTFLQLERSILQPSKT
jgi:CRISPR-associated protein Csx17